MTEATEKQFSPSIVRLACLDFLDNDATNVKKLNDEYIVNMFAECAQLIRSSQTPDAARVAVLEAALRKIADRHLGDCPASKLELDHAKDHIFDLRKIAHGALQPGSGDAVMGLPFKMIGDPRIPDDVIEFHHQDGRIDRFRLSTAERIDTQKEQNHDR